MACSYVLYFPHLFGQKTTQTKPKDCLGFLSFLGASPRPLGGRRGRPRRRFSIAPEVYLARRPFVQRLVPPLRVVKPEIPPQPRPSFQTIGIVPQIDLLILHHPPQPLHKHVVHRPAPSVHADLNPPRLQPTRKRLAGKLCPWSVLKIPGVDIRSARSSAETQNEASSVFDSSHASTYRLNQSITATRALKSSVCFLRLPTIRFSPLFWTMILPNSWLNHLSKKPGELQSPFPSPWGRKHWARFSWC